jgi:hypothetical protein
VYPGGGGGSRESRFEAEGTSGMQVAGPHTSAMQWCMYVPVAAPCRPVVLPKIERQIVAEIQPELDNKLRGVSDC